MRIVVLAIITISCAIACSKSHVANASLFGDWELLPNSTSPYVAHSLIAPPGSVLHLGSDGKYGYMVNGAVKDSGTFYSSPDPVSGVNILNFNNGQYFPDGVNGKCLYSATVRGMTLDLEFCSATIDFVSVPIARFKKL